MAQCRALKVDGTPCREEALPGSQFCYRSSHQAQYQSIGKKVVQFLRKHWFGILSFVVGLTGVIALIFYFQDKAREAMTGVLTSSGEASIQHVAIGTIRFRIHNPNGVLFQDGSDPLVSVKISNKKLYASTTIRNDTGEIIAELIDNEWKVNKNNQFDRNYTKNILEVRDKVGKVALQAVHFGDTVHLAGIFRCKDGRTVPVFPTREGGAVFDYREDSHYEIPPICEYPSDRHFGSCPKTDYLKRLVKGVKPSTYDLSQAVDICP